jgi:hypothetical protein
VQSENTYYFGTYATTSKGSMVANRSSGPATHSSSVSFHTAFDISASFGAPSFSATTPFNDLLQIDGSTIVTTAAPIRVCASVFLPSAL